MPITTVKILGISITTRVPLSCFNGSHTIPSVPNLWLTLVCSPFLKFCHFRNVKEMESCSVLVCYSFHKKYHRLCGLKMEIYFLTVWESRSPRSRCEQGWFLLRVVRENHFPAPLPALEFLGLQKQHTISPFIFT